MAETKPFDESRLFSFCNIPELEPEEFKFLVINGFVGAYYDEEKEEYVAKRVCRGKAFWFRGKGSNFDTWRLISDDGNKPH